MFHGLFPFLFQVNGEVVAYKNWLLGLAEDCMPLLTPSETFILNGFRLLSCTTVTLRFKCAFVFGEFFINDGLLIFMTFPETRLSTWTFCPWRRVLFPEVCHHGCLVLCNRSWPSLGVEERWQCRFLAGHVSSPCTASSARTLVHVVQSVPEVRAVPKVCAKVLKSLAFQGKHRCFWSWGVF